MRFRAITVLILLLSLRAWGSGIGWFMPDGGKKVILKGAVPVWDGARSKLYLWLYDRVPTAKDLQNARRPDFSWPAEEPVVVLVFPLDLKASGDKRFTGQVGVNFPKGGFTYGRSVPDGWAFEGLKSLDIKPAAGSAFRLAWTLPASKISDAQWDLKVDAPLVLK